MPRMRRFLRQPAAVIVLLVLFGVTAHAASITLFTSQDVFQSQLGVPQLAYNFNNQPNGVPDTPGRLILPGATLAGEFLIDNGAINFSASPTNPTAAGFAFNFNGDNARSFGADVAALGGSGVINVSVDGLSAVYNVTSPGFIGFTTDAPFRALNVTFVPFPTTRGGTVNFVLDNVIAHTVEVVAEPSTLLLLAAGAGLVHLYTRRRKPAAGEDAAREEDDSRPM